MNTFQSVINSEKPALVDFFAEWCGPCKTMAPFLKQAKDALGDSITIIKIDIDKNPKVAAMFQVQSVPTLILFKSGKLLWRQSGVVQVEYLKRVIDQHG
jgi:thioredoxin 1